MATAQIAARTLTARIATAPFDAGFVPVAPTSTATRLADRWLFFVRAIDSSFSAAVTSPWAVGRRHPWGMPRADALGRHAGEVAPFVPSPIYVARPGSDERRARLLSGTFLLRREEGP